MNRLLAGGAIFGVTSFVALRLYIRHEVEKTLHDYEYDQTLSKPMYALLTKPMNFPTGAELAESLVSVAPWDSRSYVGPYAAIEDVLNNGRQSPYWPSNRKDVKVPKILAKPAEVLDNVMFAILRKMYNDSARAEAQAAKGIPAKTNHFIPSDYSG